MDASPIHTNLIWTKNGKIITSVGRYEFSDDNLELRIKVLETADNGDYRCIAENDLGVGICEPGVQVTVVCK